MDEKRPKRRKDKDNPYTLSKRQDKHYLSFRDGQGVLRELLINKELFELLNCFELDDLSFLNEVDPIIPSRACPDPLRIAVPARPRRG